MDHDGTYFADWTDDALERESSYQRRKAATGVTYTECAAGCGASSVAGGPCAACLEREVERRRRHPREE